MINCGLLILMTPLTNSKPGNLEGRCFDNKFTYYILAYHKYVKSLYSLTWKHDNLIIGLFSVNNKLVDQWSVRYDLKIFSTNVKINHFWQFSHIKIPRNVQATLLDSVTWCWFYCTFNNGLSSCDQRKTLSGEFTLWTVSL